MPLVLKEPRAPSPYWRVRGTYLGIYVDRSTRAADAKTARKVLKQIEGEIERGQFEKPLKKEPTFIDAAHRYVRDGHEARHVEKLAKHFGQTPLSEITQTAIDDAAHALYPRAKNATRNRAVYTPVSAILHHAGVDIRLRRPEGANGDTRQFWLRPEQAEALIARARETDAELAAFLLFLLYTGCRLTEALRLEADDVDLENAMALVRMTKNGKPRSVHLPPIVLAALASHPRGLQAGARVFRFHAGGKFTRRFRRVAADAGVPFPEGVAFHGFRHTWGSWMRRYAGLDTTGLVATGAWSTHDAARRYEHAVTSEEARRADLLPQIGSDTRVKSVQSAKRGN